jgi:hypothetical protein
MESSIRFNELSPSSKQLVNDIINTLASMPSIQDEFKDIASILLKQLNWLTRLRMFEEGDE